MNRIFANTAVLGIALGAAILVHGCTAMDSAYRGMTRMTNPDRMTLKGDLRWANPQPNLRPVAADRMSVYLRVRNTSASPMPLAELTSRVRQNIEAAGYRVTPTIDDAQFVVNADIRYFGEDSEKHLGIGAAATTVVGGVAGAVLGHQIGGDGKATGIGAVGGAVVGAGLADVMANRNKMITLDLVVDVSIGERIGGGVQTTRRVDDSASVAHSERSSVKTGAEGGEHRAGSSTAQEVIERADFLYHTNRLVADAQKIGLTPEEAMPFLSERMATALGSVLP